jgi:eukaryotic-like serine/threonine-protein kinase
MTNAEGKTPLETRMQPLPAEPAPRMIGRYHLKRVLAAGGMGTVYLAVQDRPHRAVALKLLTRGVASAAVERRFESESQILGHLHHPGIAQVYDAGIHDDGSCKVPYFVMEYIPNARSITEYAHTNELSVRERIALFARVCEAVDHGHLRGIVHRDLKPENILVDPEGNPKVIDFGVARVTDSDLAVTTFQTDVGQLVGTVQYMSPEQIDANPDDIDARTDVYALGVVLYELLCGNVPYPVEGKPLYEAMRIIRETSAPRIGTVDRSLAGDL